MPDNYASASELVRNLSALRTQFEIVETVGRFRIARIESPFFDGHEFWVVNEKGFLWEPADSIEAAREYLYSDEAREYNAQTE